MKRIKNAFGHIARRSNKSRVAYYDGGRNDRKELH